MKRFLTLLALAAAAAAVFVSTRPSEFRIERSVMIDAPRPIVFGNLDDFRRWVAWSPWEKLDSAMQRTYDGPASGPGASYHWRGNSDVGEGRMTILASEPPLRLALRLEFLAPMQATNDVAFDVSPHVAGTTEVRWSMTGTNNFVAKAFGLVFDMDATVGGDFERGLAELKRVSEEQAQLEARRAAEQAALTAAAASEEAPAAP